MWGTLKENFYLLKGKIDELTGARWEWTEVCIRQKSFPVRNGWNNWNLSSCRWVYLGAVLNKYFWTLKGLAGIYWLFSITSEWGGSPIVVLVSGGFPQNDSNFTHLPSCLSSICHCCLTYLLFYTSLFSSCGLGITWSW